MSLIRAVSTVGGLTMVSRVLGFVRDILMAAVLGAGWIADCFVIAFKLPNLMRRLFAEGAFSAAFVPIFSELLEGKEGDAARTPLERRAAAIAFAEEALAMLVAALVIVVSLCQIFMPWVIYVLGYGFVSDPKKYDLAVLLTRLTFPYLLFISLVSLMGGVLNSLHRFAAVAFTPVLLNVTLIGAMLWLKDAFATPAHGLAIGVSVSGAVQLLWLLFACRREGVSLSLRLPRLTGEVRRLFRLMLPVALGAGAYQISLFVDTFLASFLKDGSIAFLYYADRINQLPLGVIGIAIGTALLPKLSRIVAAGDDASALASQNRANGNGCGGILVDSGSTGNVLSANITDANISPGILVAEGGNTLETNRGKDNSGDGITVTAAGNTLRNNVEDTNGGHGICAVAGNTDAGGNRGTGNATPPDVDFDC